MSEPVKVEVDGVTYKVHSDGDVFRVNPGWIDSTRKVGRISPSTPQNQLEEKIRDLPNRWNFLPPKNTASDRGVLLSFPSPRIKGIFYFDVETALESLNISAGFVLTEKK